MNDRESTRFWTYAPHLWCRITQNLRIYVYFDDVKTLVPSLKESVCWDRCSGVLTPVPLNSSCFSFLWPESFTLTRTKRLIILQPRLMQKVWKRLSLLYYVHFNCYIKWLNSQFPNNLTFWDNWSFFKVSKQVVLGSNPISALGPNMKGGC